MLRGLMEMIMDNAVFFQVMGVIATAALICVLFLYVVVRHLKYRFDHYSRQVTMPEGTVHRLKSFDRGRTWFMIQPSHDPAGLRYGFTIQEGKAALVAELITYSNAKSWLWRYLFRHPRLFEKGYLAEEEESALKALGFHVTSPLARPEEQPAKREIGAAHVVPQ